MIISTVSRYEQTGKSRAALLIAASKPSGIIRHSFAFNINMAASRFIHSHDKYEKHPVLGVSLKDVNHAISEKLQELHPELPVYLIKQDIEKDVADGYHIVIDDMRRKTEFDWAHSLAQKHGTSFHVIEIVPVGAQLESAKLDFWSNGIEPCGYEAWHDISRSTLHNDGTEKFHDDVLDLMCELQELAVA